MDTKKYAVVEKVVERASLTKAAEELGLTQSGVSHIVAAVEAELGLPLLKRTRTGARLTPEGERIMPHIRAIVAEERLLRQTAEEMARRYGVAFLYRDFRPGFRQRQQEARELELYMQKYCGCVFSEEERYARQIARDRQEPEKHL